MQQEFGDRVQFLGVGVQADLGDVRGFIDQYGVGAFPHIHDADGDIQARFGDVSRSTFHFIDGDGNLQSSNYGSLDEAGLRERVEALLAS